jgi:hypothetical protein
MYSCCSVTPSYLMRLRKCRLFLMSNCGKHVTL